MKPSDLEDLGYRARQALHYLDHNPDEREGWMPYFGGTIVGGPPCYGHSEWDACDVGWRMVEAYLAVRQVLGQAEPDEPERRLRDFVLGTLRGDGLSYRPDRSWSKPHAWMWDHGRALLTLATWIRLEPTDEVAGVARRMSDGLARIALRETDGDRWFFPAENWTSAGWGDTVYGHPPTGLAIEGMVDLAGLLGDDRILEVAGHFVRWVRAARPPFFEEDGTVVRKGGGPLDYVFTHLHARIGIVNGLLKYALATDDAALFDWATRVYLHVRDDLSSTFGWVPESLESGPDLGLKGRAETCAISDMMQAAAILAEHGRPEERATLCRYGVNQLFGHQILDFAPLRHLMLPAPDLPDEPGRSYRDVPERFLGCFTGCTHVNELVVDVTRPFDGPEKLVDASGCCSQSGAKALYVLWSQAVRCEQGTLRVECWVTMENGNLRIQCLEPSAGALRLQVKQACQDLVVRLPEYLAAAEVTSDRVFREEDRVLHFGPATVGDRVTLTYPIPERTVAERVAGVEYAVRWKGGRVIEVLPTARHCRHYWWRRGAR